MRSSENSDSKIEQYLEHIERYKEDQMVESVLSQDTSFKGEVESFYGLSTNLGFESQYDFGFNFGKENPQNKGKCPVGLIQVLDGFSEKSLQATKLQYDSVREDYQRWNNNSRKMIFKGGTLVGLLGGAGGLA